MTRTVFLLVLFIAVEITGACKKKQAVRLQKDYSRSDILNSCWSATELAGKPLEKEILKVTGGVDFNEKLSLKRPEGRHIETLGKSIRRVKPPGGAKNVALTFDLCESKNEVTGYDGEIVDYLRQNNIKATFFISGKWMRSHPERTMQLMVDPLFEIGNHAWTHGNFAVIKKKDMENQITYTQLSYQKIREDLGTKIVDCGLPSDLIKLVPETIGLFRFPFGTCNQEALDLLGSEKLLAIQWDVVSSDPLKNQTAEKLASRVLRNTRPGSIVVMHANGKGYNTTEALRKIIPELQKKGFQFDTVTGLLSSAQEIETADICFELKPGDNLIYNR